MPSVPIKWVVYAGDNGGVLAYKPERSKWEQLVQTVDITNERWRIQFPAEGRGQPRWFGTVSEIVLSTFTGEKPSLDYVVRHLDDNPHNNALSNLGWGSKLENRLDKTRNKETSRAQRLKLLDAKLELKSQPAMRAGVSDVTWTGQIELVSTGEVASGSRQSADVLVKELIWKILHPDQPSSEKIPVAYETTINSDGVNCPAGFAWESNLELLKIGNHLFPVQLRRISEC